MSSAARRKSTTKRPLVYSDTEDNPPAHSGSKRPRTVHTDAPSTPDTDDDMDVDVETSLSEADTDDASRKRRRSVSTAVAPGRKRAQLVYSDDEESDEHSVEDVLSDLPDADDFGQDTPPRRGAFRVKTGVSKGKMGRVKPGQVKGAKARGLKDKEKEREITMKDERKLSTPAATTSRASSAAAQSQPSDLFANEDAGPSSAADSLPDAPQSVKDPLSQAIPKKRKLPPIKKTKTTSSGTGTSTPAATAQKPPPPAPAVQELVKPLLPASEQRKQALTGVRDIDLGDLRVYAELFKGAGGVTPRSGLKNAEERRKELDKMRDEARARRAEEAKFTFDLQCQADKIARFEQRLRAENSTVVHPNFLAAKFRDEWEADRRSRRTTPKEEGEA